MKQSRIHFFCLSEPVVFFLSVLSILIMPLSLEAAGPGYPKQYKKMNRHELQDWILAQRFSMPKETEKDMLAWPETEWGRCTSVVDYIGRVGQEFKNLCGEVLLESAVKLKDCADDMSSISGVLHSASKCADKAAGAAGEWGSLIGVVGGLTKCTLTSYIVAMDMTLQQRNDWITFIDGLDDFKELLKLADVLKSGEIENLQDISVPKSNDDIHSLIENIKTAKEDLTGRVSQIQGVDEKIGSVKEAILTFSAFKNDYFTDRIAEAEKALNECRINEAMNIYNITKLQLLRHIGSLRAAVVLAEEIYYCKAMENKFESMSPAEQALIVTTRLPAAGTNDKRALYWEDFNDLKQANERLFEAGKIYGELIANSSLSYSAFNRMKKERENEELRLKPLTDAAEACIRSCTERYERKPSANIPLSPITLPPGVSQAIENSLGGSQVECRYTTDQLKDALRGHRDSRCAVAMQNKLEKLANLLDKAQNAKNRSKPILEKYEKAIKEQLKTCEYDGQKIQEIKDELEENMRLDRIAHGFANQCCYEDKIDELDNLVFDHLTRCGQSDKLKEAHFIVRVEVKGYRLGEKTWQISGSYDVSFAFRRGEDLKNKLLELKEKIENDTYLCDGYNPRNTIDFDDPGPPHFVSHGPKLTIIKGPYIDRPQLPKGTGTWEVTSDKGPEPGKVYEKFCR